MAGTGGLEGEEGAEVGGIDAGDADEERVGVDVSGAGDGETLDAIGAGGEEGTDGLGTGEEREGVGDLEGSADVAFEEEPAAVGVAAPWFAEHDEAGGFAVVGGDRVGGDVDDGVVLHDGGAAVLLEEGVFDVIEPVSADDEL